MIDYDEIDLDGMLRRAYENMNDLQRPGVGKARSSGRCMFDVWMGVGKTFMGLTAGLCFKPQRWLIVGTKNSAAAWQGEIEKWFPELSDPSLFRVIKGQPHEREFDYTHSDALFYFTTAGALLRDWKWMQQRTIRWDVISIDEVDRLGLRNRKSEFFKTVKDLIQSVEKHHKLKLFNPMTGTWSSRGPQQKWAVLHLLAPKQYRSFWKFVGRYHHVLTNGWGREIGQPRNTEELALLTSPIVYSVPEELASRHLPPLKRIPLYLEMPKWMTEKYWSLAEDLWMELTSGELLSVGNQLAATIKLRQYINCPKTIDEGAPDAGPCIEAIVDQIRNLEGEYRWKHNIIFTPFLAAIPIFKDYLQTELKIPQSKMLSLQGGITIEELKEIEEHFRRDPDTLLVSSLRYSQSWNAETAMNVYFSGFEWDPDLNKQAEARARRTSGDKAHTVMSYYCLPRYSIARDMMDIVNTKERMTQITNADIMKMKENLRRRGQGISDCPT